LPAPRARRSNSCGLIVLDLRGRATADLDGYERHTRLLEQRARDALKMQQTAERLSDVLTDRETDNTVAAFATHIALACYQTANVASRLRRALTDETRAPSTRRSHSALAPTYSHDSRGRNTPPTPP
jgi:hypothetical protein